AETVAAVAGHQDILRKLTRPAGERLGPKGEHPDLLPHLGDRQAHQPVRFRSLDHLGDRNSAAGDADSTSERPSVYGALYCLSEREDASAPGAPLIRGGPDEVRAVREGPDAVRQPGRHVDARPDVSGTALEEDQWDRRKPQAECLADRGNVVRGNGER